MTAGKYLIHATVRTDGVVERNDVVGAIFGQTEGLLGDDLDLRRLQESEKVGRIDVTLTSEGGRSTGEITIATGLDRVETAVLASALETIDQVGPCRAEIEVTDLEDLRDAKRRAVVERAGELLEEFEAEALTSDELLEAVRSRARVEDITTFEGMPAGPRVADSDAIVIVEGRADVLRLLESGVKNAVAVEGTDVPDAIADLSRERTVTAFFDGDRGGDLIYRELDQVGEVDYVAVAPEHRSVEDLSRTDVLEALRRKVPVEHLDRDDRIDAESDPTETPAVGDSSDGRPPIAADGADAASAADDATAGDVGDAVGRDAGEPSTANPADGATAEPPGDGAAAQPADAVAPHDGTGERSARRADGAAEAATETCPDADGGPSTLAAHVDAIVGGSSGRARLLDADFEPVAEGPAAQTRDLVVEAPSSARTLVLDDRLDQATLDVAAQLGLAQVVAREEGEFVKRPTSVRIRTADELP